MYNDWILIIWKSFHTSSFFKINDRRQFAEFQSQLNQTKNAVNIMPNDIYKSPITKFENPTFGSEEKYK